MRPTTEHKNMDSRLAALAAARVLGGCAAAPLTPQQREQCGPQPTQAEISDSLQTYINSGWKDPSIVQVRNIRLQGCRAMYNGLFGGGGHTIGWEIDFEVNDTFGPKASFELRSIIRTADGGTYWSPVLSITHIS
jgi:hypothetical protein